MAGLSKRFMVEEISDMHVKVEAANMPDALSDARNCLKGTPVR